ncbi:MAG: protein translocase subunit SecF [Gammaproteobacteria bacterium]
MEFFKQDTQIDFMRLRKKAAVFSLLLMLGSFVALVVNGLHWGLEFTGGTQVHVAYEKPADIFLIRKQLQDSGFNEAVVQTYGPPNHVLIRMANDSGFKKAKRKSIVQDVVASLKGASLQSVDYIGPQVGKELATNGALAFVVAMLGTALYIAMRFEYRFAMSAAVALIHDPILILGVFAFFHIEFNLIALAAVLTVIGYSLNDTIVVFDRIRENFRKVRKATPAEIVNLSVNQTLSRTIITSALTFIAVVALFLYGGEILHGFAAALLVGIAIGTYSSIYVAGALAVMLGMNRADLVPNKQDLLDHHP